MPAALNYLDGHNFETVCNFFVDVVLVVVLVVDVVVAVVVDVDIDVFFFVFDVVV